mgnify:CR=1 FL=1|tara:strand:+ start:300 stop:470 length:171 start_codon:yes stop_codon:yes gene_type:complete
MIDLSEDQLIVKINEVIAFWVDEELKANDDTVSPEERLQEHRATFLTELRLSWSRL